MKSFLTPAGVLHAFGDSYTAGQGASAPEKAYAARVAAELNLALVNHGVGGTGALEATKQAFIATGSQQRAGDLWTWMAGFNDLNSGGIHPGTIAKVQGELRAFLATAFMLYAVPASQSTVTRNGTFSAVASTIFPKASLGLGGNAMQTSTQGDQAIWSFAGDSLVVGLYNADGTAEQLAQVKIAIDGVIREYYTGNGNADGIDNGHDNERLTHEARIFRGLGTGSHTVTVDLPGTPGATGCRAILDYFGVLADPKTCSPVLIAEPPLTNPANLASVNMGSRSEAEQLGRAIQEVCCAFWGYPLRVVRVNDYCDVGRGMHPDKIHRNDIGHAQLARAFLEALPVTMPV